MKCIREIPAGMNYGIPTNSFAVQHEPVRKKNLLPLIFCQPISLAGRHSICCKKKRQKAMLEKFALARSTRGAYCAHEQ